MKKISVLLFILFFSTMGEVIAANRGIGKVESSDGLIGNYVSISGALSYLQADAGKLSQIGENGLALLLEHHSRLTQSHEIILGVGGEWLANEKNQFLTLLTSYEFTWRYHILPLSFLPRFSLFFDFALGIIDYTAEGYSGKLRSGAYTLGVGNTWRLYQGILLQWQFRFRNLQFFFPQEYLVAEEDFSQQIDSLALRIGFLVRYY